MFQHISFNIPNRYGSLVFKIIENTELIKQVIVFNDADIVSYGNDSALNLIYNQPYVFSSIKTSLLKKQYIIFLKITFFENCLEFEKSQIYSLSDFLDSACSTMIFITDSTIVNIITKSRVISEQIIRNAINNKFKDIVNNSDTLIYDIFDFN